MSPAPSIAVGAPGSTPTTSYDNIKNASLTGIWVEQVRDSWKQQNADVFVGMAAITQGNGKILFDSRRFWHI